MTTKPQSTTEPWDRKPDPCWSCGGEAEARDDIHVRCIDTKGVNCEVMGHWFTRKTWNTRISPTAAPVKQSELPWVNYVGVARQIADFYREGHPDAAISELRKLVEYVAAATKQGVISSNEGAR